MTEGQFSDDEVAREFEALVRLAELHKRPADEAYVTAKRSGFARTDSGTWIATETGEELETAVAARIESLWREWAPRLPEDIRRAIEGGPGGDGDGAGDREPRVMPPSAPVQARSLPAPDSD